MPKYKYTTEFEVNAPIKMLYPYFTTASGLREWFADNVTANENEGTFVFVWDGDERPAKIVSKRTNHHVKFQFRPNNGEDADLPYVEFRMNFNDMTQTTFIKVTDYSDMDDNDELNDLWSQFFDELKYKVGA